jgi:hypothetical protein
MGRERGFSGWGRTREAVPSVVREADRLDILLRGADDKRWQKAWNGGWMGYCPLGGLLTSSPAVGPGRRIGWMSSSGSDNALL